MHRNTRFNLEKEALKKGGQLWRQGTYLADHAKKWLLSEIFLSVTDFIILFLELHMLKIIYFCIMLLCCYHVSAINLFMVIILLLSFPLGARVQKQVSNLIGIFIALFILSQMIYQTHFVPKPGSVNCSDSNYRFMSYSQVVIADIIWLGYDVLHHNETLFNEFRCHLLVLFVMTFNQVLRVHQKIARIDAGLTPETPHVFYPSVTRSHADENIRYCLKFIANYGFYKFGVELSLVACVFIISYRMDVVALVYSIWLLVLFALPRQTITLIWPVFILFLIISIMYQYGMALGVWPSLCFNYPWENFPEFQRWLNLASFTEQPKAEKMLGDIILFMLVSRQQTVFEIEKRFDSIHPAGSNKAAFKNYSHRGFVNPTPDHTTYTGSWLDIAKNIVFSSLFWLTLAVAFWTGATEVNILSLGYLVGSFVFCWIGLDLCLWKIRKILIWWNVLMAYNLFVILIKTVNEAAGCLYLPYLDKNACGFVQLFNIGCSYKNPGSLRLGRTLCTVNANSNLYWDASCFMLLLFQRRFFQSHYFVHHVVDVKSLVNIQAKGAALIEKLRQEALLMHQTRERKTLEKIKASMNRIKATQKIIHGPNYKEPVSHSTAILSGDYYIFEIPQQVQPSIMESMSSEEEKDKTEVLSRQRRKPTIAELIGEVLKKTRDDSRSDARRRKKEEISTASDDELTSNIPEAGPSDRIDRGKLVPGHKGTRRGSSDEILPETTETHKSKDKTRASAFCGLLRNFFDSLLETLIEFFDKHSKDYRYVAEAMKIEKRKVKEGIQSTGFTASHRRSAGRVVFNPRLRFDTQYAASMDDALSEKQDEEYLEKYGKSKRRPKRRHHPSLKQYRWVIFIVAFVNFIMSQTEPICYMGIFLNQIFFPTILSLPLPLFVFLWGSLTTIRPTKTFWVVLIAYTEITVVIKALFQNWYFPWNRDPETTQYRAYYPPLFLGIHRDNTYVNSDLCLLLILFLHRFKLKSLGLWNRASEEESNPPENLRIYEELPSEKETEERDRTVLSGSMDLNAPSGVLPKWKCTSCTIAKIDDRGKVVGLRVKEMEGSILVTYEGRRLQPTALYASDRYDLSDAPGTILLRVYKKNKMKISRMVYVRLSFLQYLTAVRKFYLQITAREPRVSADFYTIMFFFDFLTLLLVFFGYSSFTGYQDSRSEERFYLAENEVPMTYFITLFTHFAMMIVDRVFYLRKNVFGKLCLQILLVLLVHLWMFIILPIGTQASFNKLKLPQIYYVIKCLYFLMSAYQIRAGYPLRVQGHFLCKKYERVNYAAFKVLQFIPFFNQIRMLLDYICTHTSMNMLEWVKMENIYQIIFENKCCRMGEDLRPYPRGRTCSKVETYLKGLGHLTAIIGIMWFPFLLFALLDTVAESNPPFEATVTMSIGSYTRIYTNTATRDDMIDMTDSNFQVMQGLYSDNKRIWEFLSKYVHEDVTVLKFQFDSAEAWKISPSELENFNATLQDDTRPVSLRIRWRIERPQRVQTASSSVGEKSITLLGKSEARLQLIDSLKGLKNESVIEQAIPKFLLISNDGKAKTIEGFLQNETEYRSVSLAFNKKEPYVWWAVKELAGDPAEEEFLKRIPHYDSDMITIYTFSEKNVPKLLVYFSTKGILGLYISFVFLSWSVLRRMLTNLHMIIKYEELPDVDRVLQLCHDIYLARESHEFALEEDLFAKLIFLFRSPETMIKWTRSHSQEDDRGEK